MNIDLPTKFQPKNITLHANESLFLEITWIVNLTFNVCHTAPPNIVSDGLWGGQENGRIPMKSAFTIFQLQVLVIVAVTQICKFFLKFLDFPEFVSQIVAGIILGPAIQLDSLDKLKKMLFPYGSQDIFGTITSIGYSLFVFINGVQMDLSMISRSGKKAWTIALIGLVVPLIVIVPQTDFFLKNVLFADVDKLGGEIPLKPDIPVLVISQSIVSIAVVVSFLSELKILNSELGRLALSSGLLSDMVSFSISGLSVYITMSKTIGWNSVFTFMATFIAFGILVPLICRPAMFWIIQNTKEGRAVHDGYIYLIITMVFALGWISVFIKQDFTLGAFILGLSVPEGPPLGSALVKKLQFFGNYFLFPLYVTCATMKADFSLPFKGSTILSISAIIGLTHLFKIIACLIPALLCNIPWKDALALALILNTKGVVDVGVFNNLYNLQLLSGQSYAVSIVSIVVIGCLVKWSVKVLYDPSRKYAGYQKRSIVSLKPGSELRILACIHKHNHVSGITDLLDLCTPTTENPIILDVLHLIELVGRFSPIFISHRLQKTLSESNHKSYSDNVILAFDLYEHDNLEAVTAHIYTAISPHTSMHEDVCQLAVDKVASIIILPFHLRWSIDGSVESDDKNIRSVNCKVLEVAPCSIGILVTRSSLQNNSSVQVAMVYLGGKDDREALCLAKRVTTNPAIRLVVYHLVAKEPVPNFEYLLDTEALVGAMEHHGGQKICYQKVLVNGGPETSVVLRDIANEHDFFIVGRRHDLDLPQIEGLAVWSEFAELGVIGDLLASPDFKSRASVLVVQQQVK